MGWLIGVGIVLAVVLGTAWLMGRREKRMLSRETGSDYDAAWLSTPRHDGGSGPLP